MHEVAKTSPLRSCWSDQPVLSLMRGVTPTACLWRLCRMASATVPCGVGLRHHPPLRPRRRPDTNARHTTGAPQAAAPAEEGPCPGNAREIEHAPADPVRCRTRAGYCASLG